MNGTPNYKNNLLLTAPSEKHIVIIEQKPNGTNTMKFTSEQVAEITGVDLAQLRNWATRGLIDGSDPTKTGKTRFYSIQSVMQVKIASHITDSLQSNSPKPAFEIAGRISHVGGSNGRVAGAPYHYTQGDTFMVAGDSGLTDRYYTDGQDEGHALYLAIRSRPTAIVVNVSQCFEEVCRRLKLDPRTELDAMYPTETNG